MNLSQKIQVILGFGRAAWWRLRGAKVGPKVRIGRDCDVTFPRQVTLGWRSTLEPGVVFKLVGPDARFVGADQVGIGRGTMFDLSCELTVGEGTLFAPGCFVIDHNHQTRPGASIWSQPCTPGPVRIGKDVWLGAKVIVLPGVSIGDGAVVAAGSVVTRDVAPMTIVAGVPARFMRNRT